MISPGAMEQWQHFLCIQKSKKNKSGKGDGDDKDMDDAGDEGDGDGGLDDASGGDVSEDDNPLEV